MAILNSIQRLMNGYGNGTAYGTASGVALSTGSLVATTITLATVNPLFTQGYTNGIIRVKIYNGGGANTTVIVSVSVTDGTNTVFVYPATAATAVPNVAASGVDYYIDVNVDILITVITINTTLGGTTTTASMDWEFDLNP